MTGQHTLQVLPQSYERYLILLRDMRFSKQCRWGFGSAVMWCRVSEFVVTGVSVKQGIFGTSGSIQWSSDTALFQHSWITIYLRFSWLVSPRLTKPDNRTFQCLNQLTWNKGVVQLKSSASSEALHNYTSNPERPDSNNLRVTSYLQYFYRVFTVCNAECVTSTYTQGSTTSGIFYLSVFISIKPAHSSPVW